MAPPPSKRQKRLALLTSDNEEATEGSKRRSRISDLQEVLVPTRSRKQAATSSTKEKPRTLNSSTKDISTFFTAGRYSSEAAKIPTRLEEREDPVRSLAKETEGQDVIEDISDYGESPEPEVAKDATRFVLDRRKTINETESVVSSSNRKDGIYNDRQRFQLYSNGSASREHFVKGNLVDCESWIKRFPPSNLEELAVHKKKVFEVRSWLETSISGRGRKRLLVLKGPAGAGKTTVLKMLAKVLEKEINEWKPPMGSQYASEGFVSLSAHFDDFLGRSGKFNTLQFNSISTGERSSSTNDSNAKKIILIEDFPNIATTTSTALQSFRSSLLLSLATSIPSQYMQKNTHSPIVTPLVLIITESRLTSGTTSVDAFTAHRLLGSEILTHPAVSVIEFNPVAPTFIRKALDLVVQKEAQCSKRRRIPGPPALARLCEVGDIRSAIGSLEFLCVKGLNSGDWGGRVAARKRRGADNGSALTQMEKESLEMISLRENTIGLFHAVGKVVYNKRRDLDPIPAKGSEENAVVQPPIHLQQHIRLKKPETSVDKLIDETGTDVDTFVAALHENYVMSCEGPAFVDALGGCLDALSDSDLLCTSRDGRRGTSSSATSTEVLRRDEIAFQLAVRGLLFALPYPVKRSTHPTGMQGRLSGKGDSYKMFYPASLRLWRQSEQVEILIDKYCRHLKHATVSANKQLKESEYSSGPDCLSVLQKSNFDSQISSENHHPKQKEPFRTSLTCTKVELLLERLPYVFKIEQANEFPNLSSDVGSITQFRGSDTLRDDTVEDEEADSLLIGNVFSTTAPSRTGKETDETALKSFRRVEEDVEKLYLSDDDIED